MLRTESSTPNLRKNTSLEIGGVIWKNVTSELNEKKTIALKWEETLVCRGKKGISQIREEGEVSQKRKSPSNRETGRPAPWGGRGCDFGGAKGITLRIQSERGQRRPKLCVGVDRPRASSTQR